MLRTSQSEESDEAEHKAVVGVAAAFFAFFLVPDALHESVFDPELLVNGDKDLRRFGRLFSTREGTLAAVLEPLEVAGVAKERGLGIVAATAGLRDSLISCAIRRTLC